VNGALNSLYGFEELGFGSPGAVFGWTASISPWVWVLVILAAVGLAVLAYARTRLPAGARVAAGGLRAVLLLSLVALALGPRLERPRTRVERDRVLYLVDRSASMTIADGVGATRDDRMRALIADRLDVFGAVAEGKDARWYAFGSGVAPLRAWESGVPLLPAADEPGTRLGGALASVLSENAGHPVSAVVVFSDGRSTDDLDDAALAPFRQASVPVIAVPLGSASQAPDIAVESATAPSVAFVDDTVPVRVGLVAGEIAPARPGRIEVIDAATGVTLESADLTADDLARGAATVPVRMDSAGEQEWTVRYVPDGPDLSPANNESTLAIRFVDEPIRVLYLDGSPRWERRYLKNLLIREDSIDSSCLILAADRRFQQAGDTVLASLPIDEAGWDAFDLIIIGDMRSDLLGERAVEAVRTQVGERGTGLLWLAGPSATPQTWGATALGDLLPVRLSDAVAPLETWAEPVVIGSTPLADRLGLFRDLFDGGGVDDPEAGWSRLRWSLRIDGSRIKASAETLAAARPVGDLSEPSSLVTAMRYGAGRTALVATDEVWRWRYGRGEAFTERFWLPLIRHLARPRLASLGSGVTLAPSASLVTVGQRVVVELAITDRTVAASTPPRLSAVASPEGGVAALGGAIPFTMTREDAAGEGPARYRGAFTPLRPGGYEIRLTDAGVLPVSPASRIDAVAENDELRSPQTDHPALAALAEATGGRTLRPDDLEALPDALPNRRVIVPLAPEVRTLWDHWAPLTLLLMIAGAEWVIRRRCRLP
jgi:hypothetical protein